MAIVKPLQDARSEGFLNVFYRCGLGNRGIPVTLGLLIERTLDLGLKSQENLLILLRFPEFDLARKHGLDDCLEVNQVAHLHYNI